MRPYTWTLLAFFLGATVAMSADETGGLHAEFTRIAAELEASDNPYYGMARLRTLQQALSAPGLGASERIDLNVLISREELIHGATLDAIGHIDTALAMTEQAMARGAALEPQLAFILRERGLVYMRRAEDVNCVDGHAANSCIWPITGDGIHVYKQYARVARESFVRYLEIRPDDLTVRWLLNVVAMTLGEHPDAVPPAFRIGVDPPSSTGRIAKFPNIASDIGVAPMDLAGGVMVEDFDGDGDLDIVTTTADSLGPMKYFEHADDGSFIERSDSAQLDQQLGGLNAIAADYDNDGDLDILVLRGAWLMAQGRIRNSLLENDGKGTFTDVTRAAGLADPRPTQAAVWGDFDGDGDLDLYVANETSEAVRSGSNLFRNEGDGTFVDISAAAGVTNDRFAKGVAAGDFDNDGDLDLYVSNFGPNRLYENRGDSTFVDVAPHLGLAGPTLSFAPWFFDYDNDGWLDLFVGAYDAEVADVAKDHLHEAFTASLPALYHNNGDGSFSDQAPELGLNHAYMPMGAGFGDLDNDGYLDVYLGTGDPDLENLVPNVMLRNVEGKGFEDVTVAGGFGHLQKGHGIAFNDLDHDGDQDVYHQLGGIYPVDVYSNALFMNPGNDGHFVKLILTGRTSNRFGIGARIEVEFDTPGARRVVHRAVGSVSSFGGASTARQEIGLSDALRITRLSVWWPASKTRTTYRDLPLDRLIGITEGDPRAVVLEHRPMPFQRRAPRHAHDTH